MFNELFSDVFTTTQIEAFTMFAAMGTALALGVCISWVYQFKNVYTKSFATTLVVMPALVALVIFLVNGSLGTGVAVMGAFGLIRFRSAPGGAKEILTIFMAMTVGIAVGMGYLVLAAAITLLIGAVIVALEIVPFGQMKQSVRQVTVVIPESLDYEHVFDDIFSKATRHVELASVKTSDMGSLFKLKYIVQLNGNWSEKQFVDALRTRNGNLEIAVSRHITKENEL